MTRIATTTIIALIAIFATTVVFANADDITELKVTTVSKPDDCNKVAKKGDMLSMHYTGKLMDGTEFDSSIGRGEPFRFQLGIGQVIKGWDQGLLGICVGEKRHLVIPAALAYGEAGAGDKIPANSPLQFDVECVALEDGPEPVNVFAEIDANQDKQISREEVSEYLRKQLPAGHEGVDGLGGMPDQDKLVEEIFQHEDADKNGFISHEEFSGPKHDEL